MGDAKQFRANACNQIDEVGVARTNVALHRGFHGRARGEWSRGEVMLFFLFALELRNCEKRSLTSCGCTLGRPRFPGEPGCIITCNKEGPGRLRSRRTASRISSGRSAAKAER